MTCTQETMTNELENLTGWVYTGKSIGKEYQFNDFTESVGFVVKAGIVSEKADHHPDILIHSWNKVKITLSTHSEGGVTDKDINLARTFDKLT